MARSALMYVQGVTQFLTYSETDISIFDAINSGTIGFMSVFTAMASSRFGDPARSSSDGPTWDARSS